MRKVVLLTHASLDGFVAGPNGEMDWIRVDEEIFDYGKSLTDAADTALYGRLTFQVMEAYWPTAASQPNATRHDVDHANWVNAVEKIVFSRTMKESSWANTRFVADDIPGEIARLKSLPGKNLLMIGSPATSHYFMQHGLIDEFYVNVNPVVLGKGIPLFKDIERRFDLELVEAKTFSCGVQGLYYRKLGA